MTLAADLFFSFRSPYSYLALRRYRALAEEYAVEIAARPVLPLAIRQPEFFAEGNRPAGRYIIIDSMRSAQMQGVPFRWPRPDPVVQDFVNGTIPAEQPYIFRIVRLGQAAARHGRGLAFAEEAMRMMWCGETDDWHEGDHLAAAAARGGLDFAKLEAEARNDADALDAEIAANQQALEAAGHWGVPSLVFEGEPFFGQDRVDMALWRMEQKGLAKR